MRLGSWFGGILIAVAVATSVGAVTVARQHTSAAPALTASRQAAAGTSFSAYDPVPDPPHKIDAQGSLTHTNGPQVDLSCGLGHQAGENIGYWSGGINDPKLNSMFMASPDHYANIMGPYHYVATAWVVAANGYAYIAVEFS